jgi:hypothetical protein
VCCAACALQARAGIELHAEASFLGEAAQDLSGWAVAGAGDLNEDGYDDLLIGAPRNSEAGLSAGQVYLLLGQPGGWTMGVSLAGADASFLGVTAEDEAGTSVAGVGDVNGDGIEDVLIAAPAATKVRRTLARSTSCSAVPPAGRRTHPSRSRMHPFWGRLPPIRPGSPSLVPGTWTATASTTCSSDPGSTGRRARERDRST